MENPLKDQQDKDSESNICRVKCNSFSPSSGARAGNKQLLPGALVDPRRCQCRGSWAGPELQEGPCGCPGSTEPCGAAATRLPRGRDTSEPGLASPGSERDQGGSPRPAVTGPGRWPGGLAAHSSPERRPGQPGVDQPGFAGCPSGITGTRGHAVRNQDCSLQEQRARPSRAPGRAGGGSVRRDARRPGWGRFARPGTCREQSGRCPRGPGCPGTATLPGEADVRVQGGMFARAGPAPALFLVPRGPEGGLFTRDRLYQMDLASLKKHKAHFGG